jgi:hypothetical protein
MKGTIRIAARAVVAMAALVMAGGCQKTPKAEAGNRPAETPIKFDQACVATRDTEWVAEPGATARNRLPAGTRVYFNDGPGKAEWQKGRIEGQGVVWLRPGDFKRETR